jgi:6-phosphofructokinase 1
MQSFEIKNLGPARFNNPVVLNEGQRFTEDRRRILIDPHEVDGLIKEPAASFEISGPREKIFFDPQRTKALVVTCGGLCPGLNAVIRALTMQLWYRYGVRQILGVKYGYQGFASEDSLVSLNPDNVESIHDQGGTILGTSRGTPGVKAIADRLESWDAQILFVIGGDGTMRGARALTEELAKRRKAISVVGIPKTIDNDIPFVRQSFGFESAVEIACQTITAAHAEARAARYGIGLVKFMGRNSGYIAANAALATGQVNFCLVPEIRFELDGEGGLLKLLERRLTRHGHAVIAVAEGAGQYFFEQPGVGTDRSGNQRLNDIGLYLQRRINVHFESNDLDVTLKYIDPSYIIRATKANPADRLFCAKLARNAVHAAMAGKTGMLIGYWHGRATHLPFAALEDGRQTINPNGELWFNVLESTGQPFRIGD